MLLLPLTLNVKLWKLSVNSIVFHWICLAYIAKYKGTEELDLNFLLYPVTNGSNYPRLIAKRLSSKWKWSANVWSESTTSLQRVSLGMNRKFKYSMFKLIPTTWYFWDTLYIKLLITFILGHSTYFKETLCK